MLEKFTIIDLTTRYMATTITFSNDTLRISKAVVDEMEHPAFIRTMYYDKMKKFAIQACEEKDRGALKFSKGIEQQFTGINTTQAAIIAVIRKMVGWSKTESYRVDGIYFPDEKAMLFDLTKAITVIKQSKEKCEINTEE